MVHHWRGRVLVPRTSVDEIIARVANPAAEDMNQEDVIAARVLERRPGSLRLFLRLRRTQIVTVVYNTEHDVGYGRRSDGRAWSRSTATRIAEVAEPDTPRERERLPGDDRGFLWRLNSYWRYEAVPGGVLVECESISLSRSAPGWSWARCGQSSIKWPEDRWSGRCWPCARDSRGSFKELNDEHGGECGGDARGDT